MTTPSAQDPFREKVRQDIRSGAVCDVPYISMNVLAAVIACYGLLANSPAVVIGAMIVAMLLGPIMGAALALVDSDMALLRSALFTLIGGALAVMITASVLGLIHRDIPITNEIMARTSPNLLEMTRDFTVSPYPPEKILGRVIRHKRWTCRRTRIAKIDTAGAASWPNSLFRLTSR